MSNTNHPSHKIALVTGASRGIGAATAIALASQGFDVCVNYKSKQAQALQVVEKIQVLGQYGIALKADVSDEKQVENMFAQIDQKLGRLTTLVNNAGILLPQCRVEDLSAERINHIITTNITGYFLCCREAIKRLSVNHGGHGGTIVNVSSVAARLGAPNEYVDYAASKGAIDTLTKGLAIELADDGIRVNGVRPGFIYTDMHADGGEADRVNRIAPLLPLKRGGRPSEIASAIAFLVSDAAAYTTGSLIDIAGGK